MPVGLRPLHHPDPHLSDGVVTLRPWHESDAPAIAAACREAEISRWLDEIPQPYSENDALAYVARMDAAWNDGSAGALAITDSESGEVLGSAGLNVVQPEQAVVEIGYWTKAEARGRGAATRATRLLARWALAELGAERVQLRAVPENEASNRVAQKAGFRREGVLRSCRYNERLGRRVDFTMYSLLPGELGEP